VSETGEADEIAAFLEQRLNEAERLAMACTPGPWAFEGDDPTDDELFSVHDGDHEDLVGEMIAFTRGRAGTDEQVANGQHMALHDPPSSLVDAGADRAVLLLRETVTSWVPGQYMAGYRDALDAVVKIRAARFGGHPDYKETWNP
jgi:hypothetical protein